MREQEIRKEQMIYAALLQNAHENQNSAHVSNLQWVKMKGGDGFLSLGEIQAYLQAHPAVEERLGRFLKTPLPASYSSVSPPHYYEIAPSPERGVEEKAHDREILCINRSISILYNRMQGYENYTAAQLFALVGFITASVESASFARNQFLMESSHTEVNITEVNALRVTKEDVQDALNAITAQGVAIFNGSTTAFSAAFVQTLQTRIEEGKASQKNRLAAVMFPKKFPLMFSFSIAWFLLALTFLVSVFSVVPVISPLMMAVFIFPCLGVAHKLEMRNHVAFLWLLFASGVFLLAVVSMVFPSIVSSIFILPTLFPSLVSFITGLPPLLLVAIKLGIFSMCALFSVMSIFRCRPDAEGGKNKRIFYALCVMQIMAVVAGIVIASLFLTRASTFVESHILIMLPVFLFFLIPMGVVAEKIYRLQQEKNDPFSVHILENVAPISALSPPQLFAAQEEKHTLSPCPSFSISQRAGDFVKKIEGHAAQVMLEQDTAEGRLYCQPHMRANMGVYAFLRDCLHRSVFYFQEAHFPIRKCVISAEEEEHIKELIKVFEADPTYVEMDALIAQFKLPAELEKLKKELAELKEQYRHDPKPAWGSLINTYEEKQSVMEAALVELLQDASIEEKQKEIEEKISQLRKEKNYATHYNTVINAFIDIFLGLNVIVPPLSEEEKERQRNRRISPLYRTQIEHCIAGYEQDVLFLSSHSSFASILSELPERLLIKLQNMTEEQLSALLHTFTSTPPYQGDTEKFTLYCERGAHYYMQLTQEGGVSMRFVEYAPMKKWVSDVFRSTGVTIACEGDLRINPKKLVQLEICVKPASKGRMEMEAVEWAGSQRLSDFLEAVWSRNYVKIEQIVDAAVHTNAVRMRENQARTSSRFSVPTT